MHFLSLNKKHPFVSYLLGIGLASIMISSCNISSNTTAQLQAIDHKTSLSSSDSMSLQFTTNILSIFKDSKKNLWIGSDGEGLSKFDGRKYVYFNTSNGLCDDVIHNIQEDENGNIILHTASDICRYDGTTFTSSPTTYSKDKVEKLCQTVAQKTHRVNEKVSDPYYVLTTYEDSKGHLWIGTVGAGVIHYDGQQSTIINDEKLTAYTLRSIYEDSDGNMWFGNNGGGAFLYDGKDLKPIAESTKCSSAMLNNGILELNPRTTDRIWAINQSKDGTMWFGTNDSGVWSYKDKTWTNYGKKEGLPNQNVHCLHIGKDDQIWVGLANGKVCFFNGEGFVLFDGC